MGGTNIPTTSKNVKITSYVLMYEGEEVQLLTFLILAINGSE
jgi:hypothetical protein